MDLEERVRARLTAYIYPNQARTKAQKTAFESAVEAQVEYETNAPAEEVPINVESFSIGNYSATLKDGNGQPSQANICPAAWAILFNAGLLRRSIPTARRL